MSDNEKDDKGKLSDDDLLALARKRYKYALDAWSGNYERMDEDIEFIDGENQWPASVKNERELEGRPCLTFNKLAAMIDQAVGDQRRASPAIKVTAQHNNTPSMGNPQADMVIKNTKGTKDYTTAEVFEGIIRNIQIQSRAENAYDTAYEHSSGWGLGWFRILTDYLDDESFDQEFIIKRIRNYRSVVADPDFQEPDGSDIKWAFVITSMPEEEFEAKYPEANCDDFDLIETEQREQWYSTDHQITVAEYYYEEPVTFMLYQTSDGAVYKDETPKNLEPGIKVINTRKVKGRKICWAKITGKHVLDRTDTIFDYVPVIPVLGKELVVNGAVRYRGLVRHAKDAQRMYNYSRTADIERTALVPKVPYIIADQQIAGYEKSWETANRTNPAVLKYKLVPGAPSPHREPPVSTNPGETQQSMQAADDIKGTIGIFDASMGARSNETSGRAIVARASQGDTVLVPFADNLSRSLSHAGRILIRAIPKLYDTRRILRIQFPDGKDDFIEINQTGADGELVHDLGVGKYDITVVTGPSYSTQRAEALDAMVQLIQANPALWPLIGDLIAKNMDWPGAAEFEKRLRSQLPPQFLTEEEQQSRPQPQPSPTDQANMARAQADMKQAEASMAKAEAEMHRADADIKTAEAKALQAEAMAMQAIEKINSLDDNIRHSIADALAEAILAMGRDFVPQGMPVPEQAMQPAPQPTNQPQPGAP